MKTKLLIVLLVCARITYAQTWVTIPDANFVSYLQAVIPSAMSGNQLNTSSTLVTTRDSINVNNQGISNLNGIQYFTSLTYLSCINNSLATLPALPSSLSALLCNLNPLYTLPALPNSIIWLECISDSLTSLPPLPSSLQSLHCYNNKLTSLPTLPNSLQTLFCQNNSITTLPVLPNSLTNFWCEQNNVDCFPTFPNSIRSIFIANNPNTCLPNYVLPYMNTYTNTPLCAAGNSSGCPIAATGIEQISSLNSNTSIYPNPNNGNFIIETNNNGKQTMQVYDVNGKMVLSQIINGKTSIDASSLNEGVYNISLQSNEGIVNKRLVIVR